MKRPILPVVFGAVMAGCVALQAAPIGQSVPDVPVVDSEGNRVSLKDLRSDGQVLVVGFYSWRCPYNAKRSERIAALAKEFEPKGVKFVGINPNPKESLAEVTESARKAGVGYPIYRDEGKALVRALDAKATPHMYVFDQKGILRFAGAFDDNADDAAAVKRAFAREAIEAVLAGREVAEPEPKAFIGCSIKD